MWYISLFTCSVVAACITGTLAVGTNMALHMPVYAHSTHDANSRPSHATDGVAQGNWGAYLSCAATKNVLNPWFIVDLLEEKTVTEVVIRTRDTAPNEFQRISVRVGDAFDPSTPTVVTPLQMTLCATFTGNPGNNIDAVATCPNPINGRFVGIFMDQTGYLTVCEISVYGSGGNLVPFPKADITPFISSTLDTSSLVHNAFDGSGTDYYSKLSCALTKAVDEMPWIAADLGKPYKVAYVIIHNRNEAGSQLRAATVAVGTAFNPTDIFINRRYWKTCAFLKGPFVGGEILTAPCPAPLVQSQFVIVYMDHMQHLCLCEITIMIPRS